MSEQSEHGGKQYKPPATHPWRNNPKSHVVRWAKEKSEQTKPHNFRVGQLDGLKKKR